MKVNSFLSWWCFRPWQIALDMIGIAFAIILYMHWDEYNAAQQMFVLMGILIPIHVFEEWWCPAGFPLTILQRGLNYTVFRYS